MKFKTRSTVNNKWVSVEDLKGGGTEAQELRRDEEWTWKVKPNSGTGKVNIYVSPDGAKETYVRYLANLLVEEGDCIQVDDEDDEDDLPTTPVYCLDSKDHEETRAAKQASKEAEQATKEPKQAQA